MAKRIFAKRQSNKVERWGILAFVLGLVALTTAVVDGTFNCGMVDWSKYFC